jgi:hypothetical protein
MGNDRATLEDAMRAMTGRDGEANAISNAVVSWTRVSTGVYSRECVEIRGNVGRVVTTVLLPSSGHHGHPH